MKIRLLPSRRHFLQRLRRPVRRSKGMALLMAIFATSLMIFLAVEVSYDTSVEYLVASQQVNRLRAYYAAKAGVEISLLRVLIYKKAMHQFGKQLGSQASMLDPIWQIPFAWPPILPEDLSSVDKELISDKVEESAFDGQYVATIAVEGGKIDINDLGSEIKSLREATRKQILTIFESEMENNQEFQDENYGTDFNEVLNNITDWIDEDDKAVQGEGPERAEYSEFTDSEFIPPNAPLKTIDELNMIAGMTPEYFKLLAPKLTIFGVKGVNINYAPEDVLMGLAPTMTEEAVGKIISRRNNPEEGGPFTNDDDFFGFLQAERVDPTPIQESKIPLYYDTIYNFRIRAEGQFSNVSRVIEVVTYDFENLKERYIEIVNKDEEEKKKDQEGDKASDPDPDGGQTGADDSQGTNPSADKEKNKIPPPKGRPTVVYWKEN